MYLNISPCTALVGLCRTPLMHLYCSWTVCIKLPCYISLFSAQYCATVFSVGMKFESYCFCIWDNCNFEWFENDLNIFF